jgi:hypothetical protein
MSSQQQNKTQTSKLSIADKCAVTFNGDRLDELIMEMDNLSDTVSRIVGAKIGKAKRTTTPADELAGLLADLREDLPQTSDTQNIINTLDAAIELAFLHSPVYKDAFEIYQLGLTGRMHGKRTAYQAIHKVLLTARGKKADEEVER